ncbi:MAG: hypothetical protein R3F56_24495 [Planctomycetota bacterium]
MAHRRALFLTITWLLGGSPGACAQEAPAAEGPAATAATPEVGRHQILWQRSLDDALALARAEGRPLLIALNMDGESASDRIVHENYRDPAFVSASRACVCLVASVFRHSPRDHDEYGRRIPCPRLGEVTCGEHIALEPILFDRYLTDGERVAPRHAVIRPDGTKAFDLSLCFDLRDIDRALQRVVDEAGVATLAAPRATSWPQLAARRDHRGRAQLEDALTAAMAPAAMHEALAAVAAAGDVGALDALRVLAMRGPSLDPGLRQQTLATARHLELAGPLAAAVRQRVQYGARGDLAGHASSWLPMLAELDGSSATTRTFLLACLGVASADPATNEALARSLGTGAQTKVEACLSEHGGDHTLEDTLQVARAVTAQAGGATLPRAQPTGDQMPEADVLERQLDELERALRAAPDDATLHARFGKASLDLGRRRLDAQQKDAPLLFQDAERHLRQALEADGQQATWWIERARTAYFLTRFREQVEYGERAFAAARSAAFASAPQRDLLADAVLDDPLAIEALRWVGDGHARLLAERAGQDPTAEFAGILDCLRALGTVAASPFADGKDWLSLGSACGALGLWHEELTVLIAGAMRLPADGDLRQAIHGSLWNLGRIDLAPVWADTIGAQRRPQADSAWFAGYARILAAEDQRRCEQPELALSIYAAAAAKLERARALRPDYAASCTQQIAHTWLGRGFAHARAGRQQQAADCLLSAVRTGASVRDARDGLGYDVLDLVDKALEWRAPGPSPVDPAALLDGLQGADPDTAFWALAVSDSCLREALRADGRNPQRVDKETVDAGGNKITMPMGLPTEEGDRYLRESMAAAARARAKAQSVDERHVVAQAPAIWAERMLERGRLDGVREAVATAAAVLDMDVPEENASEATLRSISAQLRARLGEARPRARPGR